MLRSGSTTKTNRAVLHKDVGKHLAGMHRAVVVALGQELAQVSAVPRFPGSPVPVIPQSPARSWSGCQSYKDREKHPCTGGTPGAAVPRGLEQSLAGGGLSPLGFGEGLLCPAPAAASAPRAPPGTEGDFLGAASTRDCGYCWV